MMILTIFLIACGDPIADLEESNKYSWQRHMNSTEFEQLTKGMTYMEVAEIAKGGGEKKKNKYIWYDEKSMTTIYEVTFKEDKLTKKEQKEVQAHSTRGLKEEKEEAKPE